MKVRTDFVTNSSATSFGVATVEAVITSVLTGMGVASFWAAEAAAQAFGAIPPGGPGASVGAGGAQATVPTIDESGLSPEERSLNAEARSIQAEISDYRDQWRQARRGANPDDPDFKKLKAQYDAYFDYLDGKLADVDTRKYDLKVKEAEAQAAKEAKEQWIKDRQGDLMATLEQKSLLEATIKGYGKAGFDTKDAEQQLADFSRRERELRGQLKDNNAEIDYQARDRGEIGPGAEFQQMVADRARIKAEAEAAMKKAADDAKRAKLDAEMKKNLAELDAAMKSASRWDRATKIAEGIQVGADIAIDTLANVTGPAGKTVKTAYLGLKGVAGGVGEGMASGNYAANIAKGVWKGAKDMVKEELGDKDKYGKYAKGLFNLGAETLEGAATGYAQGKGIVRGAVSGAMKGTVEAVGDALLSPKKPIQVDWSKKGIGEVAKGLAGGNPLTTAIFQSNLGYGLKKQLLKQGKNLVKGDNVIFSGWKTKYSVAGLMGV